MEVLKTNWMIIIVIMRVYFGDRQLVSIFIPIGIFNCQFQGWSTVPKVTGRQKMQQTRSGFEPGPPNL